VSVIYIFPKYLQRWLVWVLPEICVPTTQKIHAISFFLLFSGRITRLQKVTKKLKDQSIENSNKQSHQNMTKNKNRNENNNNAKNNSWSNTKCSYL
jgi:hypothetical protein